MLAVRIIMRSASIVRSPPFTGDGVGAGAGAGAGGGISIITPGDSAGDIIIDGAGAGAGAGAGRGAGAGAGVGAGAGDGADGAAQETGTSNITSTSPITIIRFFLMVASYILFLSAGLVPSWTSVLPVPVRREQKPNRSPCFICPSVGRRLALLERSGGAA